jgi:hypothetical protein
VNRKSQVVRFKRGASGRKFRPGTVTWIMLASGDGFFARVVEGEGLLWTRLAAGGMEFVHPTDRVIPVGFDYPELRDERAE